MTSCFTRGKTFLDITEDQARRWHLAIVAARRARKAAAKARKAAATNR